VECSAVLCGVVLCRGVWCGGVLCSGVMCGGVLCSGVMCGGLVCGAVELRLYLAPPSSFSRCGAPAFITGPGGGGFTECCGVQ